MRTEAHGEVGAEIKVTLSGDDVPRALEELALGAEAATARDISFFDAVEGDSLRLFDRNVVLRLRVASDDNDTDSKNTDSTAKLRPALLERLVGGWAPGSEHDGKYRVEFDWGVGPVLAASLQDKLSREKALDVAAGRRPLSKAFSDEQEQFLAECGPALADLFDGLTPAGPIRAALWDGVQVAPFLGGDSELKAEQWDCGEGLVFLELSARVAEDDAGGTLTALKEELQRRGLAPPARGGKTKTELALRHLLRRGGA